MGYIQGNNYAGDFGLYSKREGFGKINSVPGSTQKVAMQNAGRKPAGLQGYSSYPSTYGDMEQDLLSSVAVQNSQRKAAGLQGMFDPASIAQGNAGSAPAGLQGFDPTSIAQGNAGSSPAGLQGFDPSSIAKSNSDQYPAGFAGFETDVASANAGAAPAGLQGQEMDAFAGYEGTVPTQIAQLTQRNAGLGADLGSWHTHFNQASGAHSEREIIKHLQQAVMCVDDSTSEEVKRGYFEMAKKMLQKKARSMPVDIKRIELESNIGWLVDPRVPRQGGFSKLVSQHVGAAGAQLAQGTPAARKSSKLMAMGQRAKAAILRQRGLGAAPDMMTVGKYVLVGGAAYLAWQHRETIMKSIGLQSAPAQRKKRRRKKK